LKHLTVPQGGSSLAEYLQEAFIRGMGLECPNLRNLTFGCDREAEISRDNDGNYVGLVWVGHAVEDDNVSNDCSEGDVINLDELEEEDETSSKVIRAEDDTSSNTVMKAPLLGKHDQDKARWIRDVFCFISFRLLLGSLGLSPDFAWCVSGCCMIFFLMATLKPAT
jgi:hypothetical protein